MTATRVQVIAGNQPTWNRDTAGVVNRLSVKFEALDGTAVKTDGTEIYAGDTAAGTYDDTQIQALMDAVQAISARLEG